MLIFQYDFRLEFYNSKEKQPGVPEDKPKFVIETKNGAPEVNISIKNLYSSFNMLTSKEAKLTIFNVPMVFNDNVKTGDIIRILYKKFSFEHEYDFIMSGRVSVPEDGDYENGDFSVTYNLKTVGKSDFYNRKLIGKKCKAENPKSPCAGINFQGYTVEDAIKEVFENKAIISMSDADKKTIIHENFFVQTPQEFVDKLLGRYVHRAYTDIGSLGDNADTNYYFTNYIELTPKTRTNFGTFKTLGSAYDSIESGMIDDGNLFKLAKYDPLKTNLELKELKSKLKDVKIENYKPLENYAMLFIPQQEITTGTTVDINLVKWNTQTLYTHKLRTGDRVSFRDRFNNLVLGNIDESSASLSNVGDCLLSIKIYDASNSVKKYS